MDELKDRLRVTLLHTLDTAALDGMTDAELRALLAELTGIPVDQLPPKGTPMDAETAALLRRLAI